MLALAAFDGLDQRVGSRCRLTGASKEQLRQFAPRGPRDRPSVSRQRAPSSRRSWTMKLTLDAETRTPKPLPLRSNTTRSRWPGSGFNALRYLSSNKRGGGAFGLAIGGAANESLKRIDMTRICVADRPGTGTDTILHIAKTARVEIARVSSKYNYPSEGSGYGSARPARVQSAIDG
jgi:hypothetical protein